MHALAQSKSNKKQREQENSPEYVDMCPIHGFWCWWVPPCTWGGGVCKPTSMINEGQPGKQNSSTQQTTKTKLN